MVTETLTQSGSLASKPCLPALVALLGTTASPIFLLGLTPCRRRRGGREVGQSARFTSSSCHRRLKRGHEDIEANPE